MKKYVIKIAEVPYTNGRTNSAKLYKAQGFNSLVFDEEGLSRLEPLDDASYQQGLDDAWSAARKIQDTGGNLNWWIHNTTATDAIEAIEKVRECEKRKAQIKVGDVVKDEDGVVAIVVRITTYLASLIVVNGDEYGHIHYARNKTRLTKTGRHVDLSQLFGGEEE